jgi:hypothetical protein
MGCQTQSENEMMHERVLKGGEVKGGRAALTGIAAGEVCVASSFRDEQGMRWVLACGSGKRASFGLFGGREQQEEEVVGAGGRALKTPGAARGGGSGSGRRCREAADAGSSPSCP